MRKIATTLLALALLAAPGTANATYDPIGSGIAKLALDKGFTSFLTKNDLKLSARNGAKRQGQKLGLLVVAGNFDPTLGQGEIEVTGTVVFSGKRGSVPLREIRSRNKHDALIAKVGGSQLKLATSAKRDTRRSGFGTALSARSLKLTAKLATRLNKKLRPAKPFYAGQLLGSLSANAQPSLASVLPEGRAQVSLDPSFASKMDSLFVSVNPIFPAEHPGPFTFPIALGGAIAPDGLEGTLRTAGSLEFLQLGAGQVFQNELWLDLGIRSDTAEVDVEPTPAFPGKLGRIGAYDLGAEEISSDPARRTITVSGSLTLTSSTAQSFNEAFAAGNATFSAGELLGTLSFVAVGQ